MVKSKKISAEMWKAIECISNHSRDVAQRNEALFYLDNLADKVATVENFLSNHRRFLVKISDRDYYNDRYVGKQCKLTYKEVYGAMFILKILYEDMGMDTTYLCKAMDKYKSN